MWNVMLNQICRGAAADGARGAWRTWNSSAGGAATTGRGGGGGGNLPFAPHDPTSRHKRSPPPHGQHITVSTGPTEDTTHKVRAVVRFLLLLDICLVPILQTHCALRPVLLQAYFFGTPVAHLMNRNGWLFAHVTSGMLFGGIVVFSTLYEGLVILQGTPGVRRWWFERVPLVDGVVALPAVFMSIASGVCLSQVRFAVHWAIERGCVCVCVCVCAPSSFLCIVGVAGHLVGSACFDDPAGEGKTRFVRGSGGGGGCRAP